MSLQRLSLGKLGEAADSALEEAASRLRVVVAELARRLRPFPSFLNMVSIQAVELEPSRKGAADRGCVVVCPDGEICELNVQVTPGIAGMSEADQLEVFRELALLPEEYILYAAIAIRVLGEELRRRGA